MQAQIALVNTSIDKLFCSKLEQTPEKRYSSASGKNRVADRDTALR
jgi:hypothetical protein